MKRTSLIVISLLILFIGFFYFRPQSMTKKEIPTMKVERKNLEVDVKTVGELEAARSTIIASSIRGDQGKIIYLIADGMNVKPGEILIRMDPTPFEEKLLKLKAQIQEQEANIIALKQNLEWEKTQVEQEEKSADFEIETATLELNKITNGDGPLEMSRLHGAMQKAWLRYEELNGYSDDLIALQEQGFLNPNELKQAQKKLLEEKETYETAKMQYESYINHVHPMQIKKGETALKRANSKKEEMTKAGKYKIAKAYSSLEQAEKSLRHLYFQFKEDEKELSLTEIKAPSSGMVVHREEFRSGQKRKPRIGDILVKNQPLLDLPDLDSMIVKTKVREVDLFKIGMGKKSTIQVDAYPHLIFSGKVTSIGVLALSDLMRPSEEKYFEVRIALDKGDACLRPGMTTRVFIHAMQVNHCLVIPIHAIYEEQQKNYCYVETGFGYEKRAIEVGACNEGWAEVTGGVEENESVCLIHPFSEEKE